MTVTPPETPPHSWLPAETVTAWLQLDVSLAPAVEGVRQAAAVYCEEQRRDLWADVLDEAGAVVGQTFVANAAVVQAGVLAAARLWARRGSPAGLASFGEFGAAEVLRLDPDVARLLGTGRHARPMVG